MLCRLMTFSQRDIEARLKLMAELSKAAREITLPLFKQDMAVTNKAETGYDPVTEADIEAERVLRKLIIKTFPEDGIEGEELPDVDGNNDWLWTLDPDVDGNNDWLWTLDPIDGTRGFVAGVPVWSTLIAVSFKGAPVLGLIDVAAQDKRFWGRIDREETSRAWLEDAGQSSDLSTRTCPKVSDAILGCTEPLSMLKEDELTAYNQIRRMARFSRLGLDAFGYGLVAQGRMDIIVEAMLKPCDVRALMPVIEGAGGKVTNWGGGSPVDGGRVVAVGDASILSELYSHLSGA